MMASSDHGAQKPIRARGSPKCPHHFGKQVVYVCENCKELACAACVSKVHKGHELEDLGDIVPTAKAKLQDFIDKSEKLEIPKVQRQILDVDRDMLQKKQYYGEEIKRIEKQKEILIEELHKATRKLVKLYRDMEKHDMDILDHYKTSLQANVNDRNSQIQECKDTMKSGNDVQIYDVLNDLPSEFKEIPTTTLPPPPSFTPGKFTLLQLEKLVGEVTNRAPGADLHQPPQQDTKYSVVSQFTPYKGHWVRSIRPVPGNKVWICLARCIDGKPINKILLVNHHGEVQQTLDMEVPVCDFSVSPQSGLLWFCSFSDCTVRQATQGGGSVVKFKTDKPTLSICLTDKPPLSICLTADDHVVIGYVGQVVKYTQTGKVIHKTPGDNHLIVTPYHISQCPKTAHLAIVDLNLQGHGGNNQRVVHILDGQLNPLYKYRGDTPGDMSLTLPFNPWGLCYTANGSLVITDGDNKSVLLVSDKGKYQQTLYIHSESRPTSICVHNDGVLWVSFFQGSVQTLKSEWQ